MASMNRYVDQSSHNDGSRADGGYGQDRNGGLERAGFAAFRMQVEASQARSLTRLIESEIIPRMMVVHAIETPAPAARAPDAAISLREVEMFAPLAMQVEADELLVEVEALLARGVPFETVLVDLLAPTARVLGEYWETDRCDFVDVTMGLWRLQEVVHELSGRLPTGRPGPDGARRALFAPMPGEQHTLGVVMIDDIFRSEGWQTDRLCEPQTAEVLACAQESWFDIIGLTVSCECHIGPLRSIIVALRKISKNPRVAILVGGRLFTADPDLALQVGADATVPDAKTAPKVASELVRERERAVAT
jgi:methanogenic corrinoid protein MtbC1